MHDHLEMQSAELTEKVFEMLGATDSSIDDLLAAAADPTSDAFAADVDQNPWVLCIEDDQDFSLALELRLKQHGISVLRAFEGVSGVQTAMTRPAEAIILDYNLPNGRGDFVLRRLKSHPLTQHIPVIVVSGQLRNDLEKEMLHLGAARCLAKPVRFQELLNELGKYIPIQ